MLTDTAIRAAKPTNKVRTLSDSNGLQLRVLPTGGKSWRYAYRHDGKQKSLGLGPYPSVTLAAARRLRDEARELLRQGIDPGAARQDEAAAEAIAAASTFGALARQYRAFMEADGRAASTLKKVDWLLRCIPEKFMARPVASITATDALAVIQPLVARGQRESAIDLRGLMSRVFKFAAAQGLVQTDPTHLLLRVLPRPVVTARAAVTEADAFGGLLRAAWTMAGMVEIRCHLQLLALLVPRPTELRLATWSEFNIDDAIWTIPASRAKMRREHQVPLSRQALAILAELRAVRRSDALLFPSIRSTARPISENTANASLRRLGFGQTEATAHGFRASFSTLANESGLWQPDVIERCLAHVEANAVRRAYNRGEYWQERVKLMAWWADYCDGLRLGR